MSNVKNCQCGAVVTGNSCEYCRADHRTNFQKNTDAVVQGVTKVGGQIADGAKTVATTAAVSLAVVWVIVSIISLIVVAGIVITIVVIVNNVPSSIGLLNVVANFASSGIHFLHV